MALVAISGLSVLSHWRDTGLGYRSVLRLLKLRSSLQNVRVNSSSRSAFFRGATKICAVNKYDCRALARSNIRSGKDAAEQQPTFDEDTAHNMSRGSSRKKGERGSR